MTNGVISQGYLGTVTINTGTVYTISSTGAGGSQGSFRNATIDVAINNELARDSYGINYPTGPLAGTREISGTLNFYDTDGSDTVAFRAATIAKTPTTVVVTMGITSGNIWTLTAKAGQFSFPKLDSSSTSRFSFSSQGKFHESTPGAKDSFGLVCT